jgi:hypothetical protein
VKDGALQRVEQLLDLWEESAAEEYEDGLGEQIAVQELSGMS